MGKLKSLSVALVLFLGFLTLSSAEKPREQRNFAVSVRRVMVALEKAVMFYWQDRYDLNLDAYFGLRIAQGSQVCFEYFSHFEFAISELSANFFQDGFLSFVVPRPQ